MANEIIRYYKVYNCPNVTHLKAMIEYSLGGYNCFTSKTESRGYYMSISPVERSDKYGFITETYAAFTGLKQCVLPVQRKSQKKMNEAVEYFEQHILEFMQQYFGEFDVDTKNYEEKER